MIKKHLLFLLIVLMALPVIAVFGNGDQEKDSASITIPEQQPSRVPSDTDYWEISPEDYKEIASQKLLFGICTRSLYLDYFLAMQKGAVDRARDWGIEVVTADAMLDPALQLDQIDRFITMGVDGVLLNAQDPAVIIPAIKRLNEAGIPVVTLDVEIEQGDIDFHIAFDNRLGGEKAGDALVEKLKKRYGTEKGIVLEVMGDPRHGVVAQRSEGFARAVGKYPDIEVIQKIGNWDPSVAYQVVQDALTVHGNNLDAVYMHSDAMVSGVVEGIKALGYEVDQDDPERIWILALDGFPQSLDLMREGRVDVIAMQPVNFYGYMGVDWLVKILRGETPPTTGTLEVPGENMWSPARFLESEFGTGPQILTNSVLMGVDVEVDDPKAWGNWLKQ